MLEKQNNNIMKIPIGGVVFILPIYIIGQFLEQVQSLFNHNDVKALCCGNRCINSTRHMKEINDGA